jgi:hypothetical protein
VVGSRSIDAVRQEIAGIDKPEKVGGFVVGKLRKNSTQPDVNPQETKEQEIKSQLRLCQIPDTIL